jgi:hypothetical protein
MVSGSFLLFFWVIYMWLDFEEQEVEKAGTLCRIASSNHVWNWKHNLKDWIKRWGSNFHLKLWFAQRIGIVTINWLETIEKKRRKLISRKRIWRKHTFSLCSMEVTQAEFCSKIKVKNSFKTFQKNLVKQIVIETLKERKWCT